jgi:hypothetical protein
MKSPLHAPNYWRGRAEETRAKADQKWSDIREKERLLKGDTSRR